MHRKILTQASCKLLILSSQCHHLQTTSVRGLLRDVKRYMLTLGLVHDDGNSRDGERSSKHDEEALEVHGSEDWEL